MRRYFYWHLFLAAILIALAPSAALACPRHHPPCKPPPSLPLPPAAISVAVVETFSTIVYDYDCEWVWNAEEQVWVKRWFLVGWHSEWKTEERWVTAYWNDAVGAFTYYDRNGKLQLANR